MSEIMEHLVDIAVNLTDRAFDADRDAVVERAAAAGVSPLVVTASTPDEAQAAIALCEQHPGKLYCTAGTHPHHAKEWQARDRQRLQHLSQHPAVVALGEAGLDFNRDFSPRPQQQAVFEQQLQLAAETGMPLLMHERDAHTRFAELVAQYRDQLGNALLHCFTGTREELYRYRDLDLYIGITGWACDERRGTHLLELITEIPADRLLLETDAPYLLPRTLRPRPKSRRNEPAYLAHICAQLATHLGVPATELAAQTRANALRFFKLDRAH